jgi:hypothetical protein
VQSASKRRKTTEENKINTHSRENVYCQYFHWIVFGTVNCSSVLVVQLILRDRKALKSLHHKLVLKSVRNVSRLNK